MQINLGNAGAAQMNMNMVMVGRQLEKFKREKKDIIKKLQAMKKAANINKVVTSTTITTTTSTTPPTSPILLEKSDPSSSSSSTGDWMEGVREELSNMLDGIPVDKKGPPPGKSGALGSLWDFWGTLDSILFPKWRRKRRDALSSSSGLAKSSSNHHCYQSTDVALLGLTYVDFWFTVSSIDVECVPSEFCHMASDMAPKVRHSPVIKHIDGALLYAAAFYLERMSNKQLSVDTLTKATDYGRQHGNCDLKWFHIAKCA